MGVVLAAYGAVNAARIEASPAVAAAAVRLGATPVQVVLAWLRRRGAVAIPRSKDPVRPSASPEAQAVESCVCGWVLFA